jgi:hypothetical protein
MNLGKLDRLSGREKAALFVALLLVFAAATDNFAVRRIVNTLRGLDEQTDAARKTLAYRFEELRWEAAVAQRYAQIREQLGVAPSSAQAIADMKGQIDTLARQDAVSIQKMDHREPKPGEGFEEFTVDVGAFESDVKSMLRFIQDVRQAPGLMRIVSLDIKPGAGKDLVKGSMSISKLMLKESPAAETPAASTGS